MPQPTAPDSFTAARTAYPRTGWPWFSEMTPQDVSQAREMVADPDLPSWVVRRLPVAHPAVLDAMLDLPHLSSAQRKLAFDALRRGPAWVGSEHRPAAQVAWADRVARAPWLTWTRFVKLAHLVAECDLALVLPRLVTHRHFTPAWVGAVADALRADPQVPGYWDHDPAGRRAALHARRQELFAVLATLGPRWEHLASVFAAAWDVGFGHRYPTRGTFQVVGRAVARCRPDTLATLAVLLSSMPATPLPELVTLATTATAVPARGRRRTTR